jgi:hypothetical protein
MLFPRTSSLAHPQDETPFEKRSREAMTRHRAREAAKSLAGVQKEAAIIVAKLTPLLAVITCLEDGPEFSLVAAPLTEPLLSTKAKMEDAMFAATTTATCLDIEDVPVMPSLKDVLEWIATSRKTIALITSMLAMIAKASR